MGTLRSSKLKSLKDKHLEEESKIQIEQTKEIVKKETVELKNKKDKI